MRITKQARREAKQLFRSCQIEGRLDEDRVRRVVAEVISRKPRDYLALLSHFHRLVKLDVQRRTARIESAVPLEAATRAILQQNLERRYGAGLHLSYIEKPALIGGLRVRVGSDVLDGTIRARLTRLAESL
ncbi:MAG TPA: F0F1 ATP synthase subunit delta [Verrucomicrobiota bacterium]|nr:F0F1 ATP synthase subunit delta [Verrucomicrobiota bacterium]HNU49845.1 F0F1 ATP synthase subunit delta [Verrucomicrobiota bacterium]